MTTTPPCRHCGLSPGDRAGRLCRCCHADAAVRAACPRLHRAPSATSRADVLLLAMYGRCWGECDTADLILAAWELDRERFGLAGHAQQHPDSRAVATALSDRSGPVRQGWMVLTRGRVRLTDTGRRRAAELTADARRDVG